MYQESVDCGFQIFKMLDSQKLHLRAAHILTNNEHVQHRPFVLSLLQTTNYMNKHIKSAVRNDDFKTHVHTQTHFAP